MVDPRCRDREFLSHQAVCPDCAKQAKRALAFEDKLREAIDVPLPQGLERPAALPHGPNFVRQPRWLAMAASLFLAIGVAFWMGRSGQFGGDESVALDVAVLNHITRELHHLHEQGDIRPARVQALLAGFGGDVRGDIGHVSFASACDMRKARGVHLVLAGARGPVTVLVMPGEYVVESVTVRSPDYRGVVVPIVSGSMAVVGEPQEPVDQMVQRLRRRVVWEI